MSRTRSLRALLRTRVTYTMAMVRCNRKRRSSARGARNCPAMSQSLRAIVCLAVFVAGCSESARSPAVAPPVGLSIAAASDLQLALPEVIAAFERQIPAVRVRPAFGASGTLARQIEQGADFDVFLSANRKFVDDLAASGRVRTESVRSYAIGTLVLAVPSKSSVAKFADLSLPEVRQIAIANPVTAPYGTAGREALQSAGLWESLQPKIVTAGTVRQALQYVESGNVDAALVGRASVAANSSVKTIPVDRALYKPIVQGLGIVSGTQSLDAASAFSKFLEGPPGQAILGRFGFASPGDLKTGNGP